MLHPQARVARLAGKKKRGKGGSLSRRAQVPLSPGGKTPFTPGPGMTKLLLVEDDPFQSEAIKGLCEQCNYKTLTASNATEAMSVLRERPDINLVLSDVMMEAITGFELLCQIRELRTSVAVVMLSAYESIDLVEQVITNE